MAKLENVKIVGIDHAKITGVEYNGKIYKKVDEEAQVGDLVRVKDKDASIAIRDVSAGAFYEIYENEYCDLVFFDDEKDEREYNAWHEELEVFRAVQTVENALEKRVAELERRLAAIERKSERLKVGDYTRVVGDTIYGDIKENSIVKIVKLISDLDKDDDYKIELLDGSNYDYARPSSLEKYTGYNDEIERSKFKKGDKVRLVSGGDKYPLNGFYDGEVYEVDDNNYKHEKGPFGKLIRIVKKDGSPGYARPDQLEKVDSKLGRKPVEFKKGDIVRVLDSCGSPLMEGCLYEISGHMGNTEYVTFDGEAWLAEFELVAPVESRVDLD